MFGFLHGVQTALGPSQRPVPIQKANARVEAKNLFLVWS